MVRKNLKKNRGFHYYLENLSMNEPVLKPRDSNSFIFDAFFDEKSFRFYGNWKNLKPNGLGFSLSPTSLEIGDFKVNFFHYFFNGKKKL